MNKVQRLFCVITLLSSLASAWGQRGLADCGGLFLLDQTDQSFSAFRCNATDSIIKNNVMVYGGYGYLEWDAFWNNGWLLEAQNKEHFGQGGFRGDSRYLSLGADFSLSSTREYVSGTSTLKLPDSLFYAKASLSRLNNQLLTLTWIAEDSSDLLDTVSGNWETKALKKELSLGMVYRKHHVNARGSLITTKRASLGENHYSIRDSSIIYTGLLKYDYHFDKSRFSLQWDHINLQSYIYGIKKDDEDTKRFLYLPIEMQYNKIEARYFYTDFEFHITYGDVAIQIPQETRRFFETLSPNRILDNSMTQVMSFSFYKKNYRITGDLDAYWLEASLRYSLKKEIGRWHWEPALGIDFYRVQGDMNIIKTNESSNIFGGYSSKEYYVGRFTFVGANVKIASRFESPARRFFLDFSLGQLIPFYFHYIMNEINTDSPTENLDSNDSTNTKYRPFRDGFSTRIQLGVSF